MKPREPKVSVGLPVYNGERYLAEAIDAILSQTFEDFELIISDNASTDTTSEICQRYVARDRRVRYYRNERNLGATPNFNRTFKLTCGKYFKWAAHDDLLAPTYLERCVAALDADPTAVLCQAALIRIDEHGRVIDSGGGLLVGDGDPVPSRRFARVVHKDMFLHIFGLIRSEVLGSTPLLTAYLGADRILLAELALRGRFVGVQEPLFKNRDHPQRFCNTALRDTKASVTWFDSGGQSDRSWHHAAAYRSYFAVVRRSAPTLSTRLACYGHLLRCG